MWSLLMLEALLELQVMAVNTQQIVIITDNVHIVVVFHTMTSRIIRIVSLG